MAMDLLAPEILGLRSAFSVGIVALLLAVEWLVPFRAPIQSKLEHASYNLIIFGSNSLIAQILSSWTLLLWSGYVTGEAWGLLYYFQVGPASNILLSVILLDFIAYGVHRLYHYVPFLWRFHRAHHSDLDIDATTSVRFHLGEVLVTSGIRGLSVLGLGISPVGLLLSDTITFSAALFSHGNLRLPKSVEPTLRLAIVTPAMHWIHHSRSPAEHNTNLGAVFSGWDRLFGTYFMGLRQDQITFGLNEYPASEDVTILRLLRMPFDPACRRLH